MKYKLAANDFDLLRLVLATSVIFLHIKHLSGVAELESIFGYVDFISSRAVPGFFIVSGFLIFMSFDLGNSLKQYCVNRFLRLYPAYFIVIALCVLVGAVISSLSLVDYAGTALFKYILANLMFLNFIQPTLPGVFETNSISVVNGSLWTLKIEVMFYAMVPFIAYCIRKTNPIYIILVLIISSFIYRYGLSLMNPDGTNSLYNSLDNQLPSFLDYFATGLAMYLYYDFFKKYCYWFLAIGLVLVWFELRFAEPIFMGSVIILFFVNGKSIVNLRPIGDLSYGVYIFHFPLIQLFVYLGAFDAYPIISVFGIFLITFLMAKLSWDYIERPSLKLKKAVLK